MVYQVVSIRDDVHQEYQGLSLELSDASAIRNFSSAFMSAQAKKEGLFFSHPDDYSLWNLGEFDSESGVYQNYQPRLLVRGAEI